MIRKPMITTSKIIVFTVIPKISSLLSCFGAGTAESADGAGGAGLSMGAPQLGQK